VVWSGDSRVYLVRNGSITQLSRDHNEAQELVDKGVLRPEEAKTWPRRNVITRALGVHDTPELDIDHGSFVPSDAFVICSDGLTTHVDDKEILVQVSNSGAQAACDALVALALERGGTDNVTVVVIHCRPQGTSANGGTLVAARQG
jgi:protein phosphatase